MRAAARSKCKLFARLSRREREEGRLNECARMRECAKKVHSGVCRVDARSSRYILENYRSEMKVINNRKDIYVDDGL